MSKIACILSSWRGRSPRSGFALFALLFALVGAIPASALTIALDPVEDPLYAAGAPTPYDSLLTGCLDGLFEAGLIATNEVPARSTAEAWRSPGFGLSRAREGYVDYLVAIWAEWTSSAFKKDTWLPARLEWRLVRVSDGLAVASGLIMGPPDSAAAAADADRSSAAVGRSLAAACLEGLGPRSNGGH